MSTSENTRNGTASNVFVYTNTKMSLSRGHFETFRGDPKTLRAELTSGQDHRQRGFETHRGRAGKYKLPDRIQKHTRPPRGDVRKNDKGRNGARKHGRELKEPEEVYPRAKLLTEIRSDRPQKRASSIYRGGTERRELSN